MFTSDTITNIKGIKISIYVVTLTTHMHFLKIVWKQLPINEIMCQYIPVLVLSRLKTSLLY